MTSRRDFLKVTGAAGRRPGAGPAPRGQAPAGRGRRDWAFHPNAYLAIRPDGTAVLTVPKSEMGQGVRTALPLVLAEELDLDMSRVELVQAMPGPDFPHLGTGGSTSVSTTWTALRTAGAAAREMLVAAAAKTWGVPADQCRTEKGFVLGPGGKKAGYGTLVEAAAKLPVPKAPRLKTPADFHLLGRPTRRVDGPKIITGKAVFGLDVRRPGQRFAAILRCPVVGGQPKAWDDTRARAVRGVKAVMKVPTGLAVVADGTWAAFKGREALATTVTWDEGPHQDFNSRDLETRMRAALDGPADPARQAGDVPAALKAAARVVEAEYFFPFQSHATMEPMNATVHARADGAELWMGTQAPNSAQERAAKALGLKTEQVQVNVALLGGGFGRRSGTDFSTEAAQVAKAVGGGPIQVVWSREDDFRHDQFHPATLHRLKAGMDSQGGLTAWSHRMAGGAVLRSWLGGQKAPGQAETEANGAHDIPYDIPALDVAFAEVEVPVALGWWRAIEIVPNVFARECFLDEVAHSLGKDPLAVPPGLAGAARQGEGGARGGGHRPPPSGAGTGGGEGRLGAEAAPGPRPGPGLPRLRRPHLHGRSGGSIHREGKPPRPPRHGRRGLRHRPQSPGPRGPGGGRHRLGRLGPLQPDHLREGADGRRRATTRFPVLRQPDMPAGGRPCGGQRGSPLRHGRTARSRLPARRAERSVRRHRQARAAAALR